MSALAFCATRLNIKRDLIDQDVDDDGQPELLVGTEDFEIRALKSEDAYVLCDATIISIYFQLCTLRIPKHI